MVNKKFWWGVLVMTLVFAMTAVGCDNKEDTESEPETDPALDGAWFSDNYDDSGRFNYMFPVMIFSNGVIEKSYSNDIDDNWFAPEKIGNYTTTRDGTITITYTHYHENALGGGLYEWNSKDDVKTLFTSIPQKTLNDMFSPHTYTYSINDSADGEILIIEKETYKRISWWDSIEQGQE